MKLLIDMNLSPRWRELLHAAGFEAEHWSSLGEANAPDPILLAFAATHDWVLLTHDLDFSAILAAAGDSSPSVVQLRVADLDPDVLGPLLIKALRETETALLSGCVLTIEPTRVRIRQLPINRS